MSMVFDPLKETFGSLLHLTERLYSKTFDITYTGMPVSTVMVMLFIIDAIVDYDEWCWQLCLSCFLVGHFCFFLFFVFAFLFMEALDSG